MPYTIKDVAKKANVSIATVSRILNNQTGYSEKTKKKVLTVIEELGYHPNAVARGLVNKRTHTIGVLVPALSSMFVAEVLDGIEKAANEAGSSIIVCHTESNGEKTMNYLQLLNEKRIDGIIFTSGILKDEYYEFTSKMKIPMVLLATLSHKHPVPYVKVDDYKASYAAAEYLVAKGHTKIGMISGNKMDIIAGIPRIEGFKKALEDHGISVNEKNVVYCEGFAFLDGVEGSRKLLEQNPELTAIFAASDELAIGAYSTLYQMDLRVPDDLSIIGYDNLSIAKMSIPPLTTVEQPLIKMGEEAARMVFSMLESGEAAKSRIMPHQMIERLSVKEKG
ncbi:LacI family DNA-binding transcriptional regulator [Peribacillus kribbensis]|uniref:LacI family DNA-binding transcriptional regulator n=1 Tax=Peribacillus kribbensis TaxID=356658 RepID=UPI0004289289|nr:LacI family DNA-binding transcriptional regulator [Peribacillus kribbensis]